MSTSQKPKQTSPSNWPDSRCSGPHKEGQRMIRWQHTQDCRDAYAERNKIASDPAIPEDATIVERGRLTGAL